jgi:predicted O-methyltransferase YrrM
VRAFDVAETAKGWLHPEEGPALYDYALKAPAGHPLLEVGTYCGKSSCWIGAAAQQTGTVLFTVDHHRGSPEMNEGQNCHDPDVVVDGRHDTLPTLRRNVAAAGLEGVVVPVVAPSEIVGRWWTTKVGFLFIDGGHDAVTAMNDYENFARHVVDGGFLLFHDAYGTEARDAVEAAKGDGFAELEVVGCTSVLTRC